jgi:hypothetical protein
VQSAWLSVHPRFCATIDGLHKTESTYALVEVDRVFACDDIGDGAAAGLASRLLCGWGHFYRKMLADVLVTKTRSISIMSQRPNSILVIAIIQKNV